MERRPCRCHEMEMLVTNKELKNCFCKLCGGCKTNETALAAGLFEWVDGLLFTIFIGKLLIV
jgi:hypothetical protein